MSASKRTTAVVAVLALAALVAGCGAGGFSSSAPAPTPRQITSYVALGDGFAAAPYLGPDVSGTGCLRSAASYPTQVARALRVSTLTDVTCVGATTKDLTTTSNPPRSETKLAPQLDAITADTDLVTLGIGIEDKGLLRGMFNICTSQPCGTDLVATDLLKQLDAYATSLSAAITTIQDVAPKATIVVVGYPQIMPPSGLCDALPRTSETQLGYAFKALESLNENLRAAAAQAGASYIDVAALTGDRTACSSEAWVSGSTTKRGKVQAFHPVAAEQDAVAQAVIDQVRIVTADQR